MDYIQKKYLDVVRLKLYSFMIYHVVAFWTKEMMYKSVKLSNIKFHILFLICGAVCTTYKTIDRITYIVGNVMKIVMYAFDIVLTFQY